MAAIAVSAVGAVGAVILAAGAGRRLGGVAKALLVGDDGRRFLDRVIGCAADAGVGDWLVVVGPPFDDAVGRQARALGAHVVHNPAPWQGMASSVAAGFGHLLQHERELGSAWDAALLWPVDHARVRADTVRAIAAGCGPQDVVIPTYGRRGGHPTGLGRACWQDLAGCASAPQGARSVIRAIAAAEPGRVRRIEVEDSGVIADVDTPEDRA